jgi:Na+/H+ antiporter NhaD/arsenite permease-like protein
MTLIAVLAFAGVLAVVAFDWLHRTKAALVGAGVVVLFGAITVDGAIEAIDWKTLGLLVGMMIIVGLTERTGVFAYLALQVAQLSRGRPLRLVFLLALTTGVLSAFLDNLTAILLVVPITLLLADALDLTPVPLVMTEILASNIGGTATLIGDPPNIMIGSHVRELTFLDFLVNLAPVSAITLVIGTGLVYLLYRRGLQVPPERAEEVNALDPADAVRGRRYLKRSLAVLFGTIAGFFLHAPLHIEPAVVALTGATVMLVVAADDVEDALEGVEWGTIFFFLGLFVLVGALERRGVIATVADGVHALTGDSVAGQSIGILWIAALGSAAVDNIPFTAAMIPVVDELQAGEPSNDAQWWALALGACFGGNATMIAAAANVAALGVLERAGQPISFLRFLYAGLPVTLVSLVIATVYLLLFQV